jgi:hypothetical protein
MKFASFMIVGALGLMFVSANPTSCLELHPDDTWAKDQIVSLSKDK